MEGSDLTRTSINISIPEFAMRAEALRAHLAGHKLNGAVLFNNYYILYFTGFAFIPTERPIAFILSATGEKALFVPRLETEHARAQTGFEQVHHYLEYPDHPHPMEILQRLLVGMGITDKIGVDTDGYPWILGYRGPSLSELTGAHVQCIANHIEDRMAIKSASEIALIRESAKWGNLAHQLLQRYTRPGVTETEVSSRAGNEATMAMVGALGPLYRSLSMHGDGAQAGYRGQIGRNGAIPHALANNITFREGDVLVTGAGAPVWGYHSELERTMIVGKPTGEQARMFQHMCRAQEVAIAAMRPGVSCADVDRRVRAYYEANDLLPYWKHHSGHAIGLRYHEGPFLDVGDQTEIRPGMVFTVEPGLYLPDLGGFRHSDTVAVTEAGTEVLTYYPRDIESLTIVA